MLRFCCRARFHERAKLLLLALCSGDAVDISDRALALCDVGRTSGVDYCFGLGCALQDILV